MNRRDFLRKTGTAAAVGAVAPKVLGNVEVPGAIPVEQVAQGSGTPWWDGLTLTWRREYDLATDSYQWLCSACSSDGTAFYIADYQPDGEEPSVERREALEDQLLLEVRKHEQQL